MTEDVRVIGLRIVEAPKDSPTSHDRAQAPAKLFISYGRRDASKLAGRLANDLRLSGYEVWLDTREMKPGTDWQLEITEGLRNAQLVVAILSPHSVRTSGMQGGDSDSVCLSEITWALFHTPPKRVVPVMAETCEPPLCIFHLDYADLRGWSESDERYRDGFRRLLEGVKSALRGETHYRSWFRQLDPWDFAAFLHAKREGFHGRQWLFDRIDRWREEAHGEPALLIKGDPGTGKSAVVADLVHRNPDGQVLAYHCCQWDTAATLEPWRFVRSVAAMIASQLDAYAQGLTHDPGLQEILGEVSCRNEPATAFERGVLAPLQRLRPPEGGSRYLLIDALDESLLVPPGTLTLVDLLASRLDRLPAWLRVVATTRKEPLVLERMAGLRAHEIDAQSAENLADLRGYLTARLSQPRLAAILTESDLRPEGVAEALVERSDGNFLYAVQALDGVERGEHDPAQLDALPPGLGGLYAQRLARVFPDESAFSPARAVLDLAVAAFEPLTEEELGRAIDSGSDDGLGRALTALATYLPRREDADGAVRFGLYHKSFGDWLTAESRRGQIHTASPSRGHERLARMCWQQYENGVLRMSRYALSNLVRHLVAARRLTDAERVLLDRAYLEARRAARSYRPRPETHPRTSSSLVGRTDEMEQLRQGVADLASGRGGILHLTGEAGIGKSRLVAELQGSLEATRARWLVGRCISVGQNLPFHPFAEILQQSCAIESRDDEPSRSLKLTQSLERLMPEDAENVRPFLAGLVGAPPSVDDRKRLQRLPGDALRRLVLRSVTQLLRRLAAASPIVLVFEDLHWADRSSIELLEALLRIGESHPILFLLVYRPSFSETSDRILRFASDHHFTRSTMIHLAPLAREALRALVRNLVRGEELPERLRATLEEKASGNPFFVEEAIRSLLDEGALERRRGVVVVADRIHMALIPSTIQELVMTRINRLAPAQRNVLEIASAIGSHFYYEVLEEVAGKKNLDQLVESLVDAEMLIATWRPRGLEYSFNHPVMLEVAYSAIPQRRREALHVAIGSAIETKLTANVPGFHATLAFHFGRGGDLERAEEYLFRAGAEASRSAASNEALHFFQQASALYLEMRVGRGDPQREALLESYLADAFFNRGQLAESVSHFDRALGLLGKPAPRNSASAALQLARSLAGVLAFVYLPRRRRTTASDGDRRLMDLMFRKAMALSTTSHARYFSTAIATLHQLSRYDPFSIPESAAIYSGGSSLFSFSGLSFGVSRRLLEFANELVEGGAVQERGLYVHLLNYVHHFLEGDWSERRNIEEPLLAAGLRDGRVWEVNTYYDLDAWRRLRQGNFGEVSRRIEQIAEIADLFQHDLAASAHQAHTAFLHLERRELSEAQRAARNYQEEHEEAPIQLLALGTRAKIEILLGDLAAAEQVLQMAEELIPRAGWLSPFHMSTYWPAQLLYHVWRLEGALAEGDARWARAWRRRARASAWAALRGSTRVAAQRPEVLRLLGRLDWLIGRPGRAQRWWSRGLEVCRDLGARPELGRTLAELAQRLDGEPWPSSLAALGSADRCREEARRVFQVLGLTWDLARLERDEPV